MFGDYFKIHNKSVKWDIFQGNSIESTFKVLTVFYSTMEKSNEWCLKVKSIAVKIKIICQVGGTDNMMSALFMEVLFFIYNIR